LIAVRHRKGPPSQRSAIANPNPNPNPNPMAMAALCDGGPPPRNYGDLPENCDPSHPPFKVTRIDMDRSATCDFLLVIHRTMDLSCTVSKIKAILAKLSHSVYLTKSDAPIDRPKSMKQIFSKQWFFCYFTGT